MKLHDYLFGIAIVISVLTAFTDAGYPCNYCRPAYSAPAYKPPSYTTTTNSVVYQYTINYPQGVAQQGSTHYGLSEISGNYLAPFDAQALYSLALATSGRLADHAQALTTGTVQAVQATATSVTDVQSQALKVKASEIYNQGLNTLVQQLKVEPSTVTVTAGGSAQVAAPAQAEGVYVSRCLSCHSEASAAAKGGGSVLPGLATLTREQRDLVLDRIHRHGSDRMPKGGSLTDDERRALEGALK